MKRFITVMVLICTMSSVSVWAQLRPRFEATLSGYAGNGDSLSFWALTNRHGIVPASTGGLLTANIHSGGLQPIGKGAFGYAYGASFAGQLSTLDGAKALVDELYASIAWKPIRLDIGMHYRGSGAGDGQEIDFNGLGIAGGNVSYSGNARNHPGYLLTVNPVAVPFTNKHLWLFGSFGDYMMIDDRYVSRPLLHNQSLYLRVDFARRFDFTIGLDHWAIWNGTNPDGTRNPYGFVNYCRILTGASGGEDANLGDRINVLGDHKGRMLMRLTYRADDYRISLSRDTPYEDGSGMAGVQNFPDGVWSLYFGRNDRNKWVSDVIYEFIYTKDQSGEFDSRPATDEEKAKQDPNSLSYGTVYMGGGDNYYASHGTYRSGWFAYGRMIGLPLLSVRNTRIMGHHFGVQGMIAKLFPYRLLCTYTENYGTYTYRQDPPLRQISLGLDGEIPLIRGRKTGRSAVRSGGGDSVRSGVRGAVCGAEHGFGGDPGVASGVVSGHDSADYFGVDVGRGSTDDFELNSGSCSMQNSNVYSVRGDDSNSRRNSGQNGRSTYSYTCPLSIIYGIYYDHGQLLGNTFTATIGLRVIL
ncbi:MAG: capsule assembly Wzi family protein [Bacteroidales bacterium]|nr:capsule assembly Wzi family protein [Bacteroidales bacterium]